MVSFQKTKKIIIFDGLISDTALMDLLFKPVFLMAAATVVLSCSLDVDTHDVTRDAGEREVGFAVRVTRDGEEIPDAAITRGGFVDTGTKLSTMDKSIPFGLVGVDCETGALLLDNEPVSYSKDSYRGFFQRGLWDIPSTISLSAYYPHVNSLSYGDEHKTYSIEFTSADTEAGPLVSKTVQCAVDQLNMVPLEFQHITNDIGFKICDVTSDPNLQGLIRLRKVTAARVASAGVFVNDMEMGSGFWHRRGYYRTELVFEGDARVGVGMENELFIGRDALVPRMADSYRFYAIPDKLEIGKQYVEVVFDIDGFDHAGNHYKGLKEQKVKYMLYGVLPDNVMAYGKQYTFHLGLDAGKFFHSINFTASASDWETKIFEDNDVF